MTVKILCCAKSYAKHSRYRPGRTVADLAYGGQLTLLGFVAI